MSSDSKPLFGNQRRLGETAQIRPANGSSTSEYSPLHQPNQPLHSSKTRYEFSMQSPIGATNSVEPA